MTYKFKGKKFDEFDEGQEFTTASRTITEGDVTTFAGLSGDFNLRRKNRPWPAGCGGFNRSS
jgi:hypothetical protein